MKFVRVIADWDPEALVWTATSPDVPGLVAESPSIEMLHPKILAMIGDLMEEGVVATDMAEIPVHIIANSHTHFKIPDAA